ncbi:hypothetical protein NC652_035666 [Populus alba x Populus x berolinensis]|nr:hypothetical protein NC652_035666 [Populus alba x Populus x berolinensis]
MTWHFVPAPRNWTILEIVAKHQITQQDKTNLLELCFRNHHQKDPFPAEIESAFAEKVLGNVDTEHKILIPTVSALSLSQQECTPISPLQDPMSMDDAQKLLKKVNLEFPYGFFAPLFSFKDLCGGGIDILAKIAHFVTLVDIEDGKLKSTHLCICFCFISNADRHKRRFLAGDSSIKKLRDFKCGVELSIEFTKLQNHVAIFQMCTWNRIKLEPNFGLDSLGGLSMTDFIVAAKIDGGLRHHTFVPRKSVYGHDWIFPWISFTEGI